MANAYTLMSSICSAITKYDRAISSGKDGSESYMSREELFSHIVRNKILEIWEELDNMESGKGRYKGLPLH